MAFVLIAIGALMSGAGAYAVIYGYSIIQLEEGWASVISGATLIAGGVVTIALALVLRTLNEVKSAFLTSPARIPPEMAPAVASPPPPVEVPMRPIANMSREAEHEKAEPAAQMPSYAVAGGEGEEVPSTDGAPSPAPNVSSEPFAAPAVADETQPDEVHHPLPEPEPQVEAPRAADNYKLETPSTPEHDLWPIARNAPAPGPTPAAPPQMDDWLDRAFAELDRDTPPLSPPVKPTPPSSRKPILETAAAERPSPAETAEVVEAPASASYEAPGEPAPSPVEEPQPLPPSTSAVIGRYESDGTLYVMYADGSIEAQSASGVYRFASMAELKAFIED